MEKKVLAAMLDFFGRLVTKLPGEVPWITPYDDPTTSG